MSDPITTGTNEPQRLKDGKMFDPRGGWQITRRWRGTQAAIETLAVTEVLLGNRFVITPADDGGLFILESTFADIDNQSPSVPLSDIWELDANALEKELWHLPWVKAIMDAITDTQLSGINVTGTAACNWIRKAIEAFTSGTDRILFVDGQEFLLTYENLISNISVLDPAASESLKPLIALFAKGVKAFPVGQFVLKRTRTVANNFSKSNIENIYDDVFKRRTTGSLESAEGIPSTIRFALPVGEWVKQPSIIRQTSATKWTIQEEWYHADKWEPEIYGDLI